MSNKNLPNLLVVDEIEDNRVDIKKIFQSEYNVIEAGNEQEAFEAVVKHKTDIAIADLKFVSLLNKDKRISDIPVVAAVDIDKLNDGAIAIESGAVEFITRSYHCKLSYP